MNGGIRGKYVEQYWKEPNGFRLDAKSRSFDCMPARPQKKTVGKNMRVLRSG